MANIHIKKAYMPNTLLFFYEKSSKCLLAMIALPSCPSWQPNKESRQNNTINI
jgi:hypothetical protein